MKWKVPGFSRKSVSRNAKSDQWGVSKERDTCSTCRLAWVPKCTRGKRRNLTYLAPEEIQGPWIA